MALTFNLPSQIVVQTAAQWAVDATVYSNKRILVTSDEYYGSTDQRKFKIADGVQTWSNLDYMPVSQTLAEVLAIGNLTGELAVTSDNTFSSAQILNAKAQIGFNNGVGNSFSQYLVGWALLWWSNNAGKLGYVNIDATANEVKHTDKVKLDAPTISLPQATASRIVETDASKNLTYAAKNTGYNLDLGTTAGTVLEGNRITQTITNGVTDKAPSEDAVYDALALKANTTDTHLLFQGAFLATSLSDSVIYYFSNMNGLAATGTQSFSKFGFDKNKKITNVVLSCSQNVNYSNESVSLYLRKNATTDSTITTSLDLSTVGLNTSKVFYYTVNIDVTTGDDYEFKIVTPAFATNGTNSRWHIELYGY